MSATIVIPMLPPREVSPNFHGSWRAKASGVRAFREAAGWATLHAANAQTGSLAGYPLTHLLRGAVMDVEIGWCCGRKRLDDDNAWGSLKAARDGIADVLFAGEDRFITQGTLTQTRGDGAVRVTLRAPGEAGVDAA